MSKADREIVSQAKWVRLWNSVQVHDPRWLSLVRGSRAQQLQPSLFPRGQETLLVQVASGPPCDYCPLWEHHWHMLSAMVWETTFGTLYTGEDYTGRQLGIQAWAGHASSYHKGRSVFTESVMRQLFSLPDQIATSCSCCSHTSLLIPYMSEAHARICVFWKTVCNNYIHPFL